MQSIAHIKRVSTFIREIEIKTTMRHHFTIIKRARIKKKYQTITSVKNDTLEPSYIAGSM